MAPHYLVWSSLYGGKNGLLLSAILRGSKPVRPFSNDVVFEVTLMCSFHIDFFILDIDPCLSLDYLVLDLSTLEDLYQFINHSVIIII